MINGRIPEHEAAAQAESVFLALADEPGMCAVICPESVLRRYQAGETVSPADLRYDDPLVIEAVTVEDRERLLTMLTGCPQKGVRWDEPLAVNEGSVDALPPRKRLMSTGQKALRPYSRRTM